MRRAAPFCCAVLCAGGLAAQVFRLQTGGEQQATGNGSIQGTVINEVTHEPVRKAQVMLHYGNTPPAVTDATGHFAFQKLPAGTYSLTAQHPAFPQVQSVVSRFSASVTLGQDEQKHDLVITLMPGASISGRVTDEDGKPIAGCSVQTAQFAQGPSERKLYVTRAGSSDDRGQYRLEGLAKGHYYVLVQCQNLLPAPHAFIRRGPGADLPHRRYPPLFYPSSQDLSGATRLMLAAGADLRGIDFEMHPVSAVNVFGHLTGDPEALSRNPWVRLAARDPSISHMVQYSPPFVDTRARTFRIDGVPPGSYTLWASAQDPGYAYQAKVPVDVGAVAPEPIEVPLIAGADFGGSLTIDGEEPAGFEVHVRLVPLDPDFSGNWPDGKVDRDGTFTLTSVLPGRWRVEVGLPRGYVRSFSLGDMQLSPYGFDVAPGAAGRMHILASTKTAEVEGTVSGARAEAPNPAWVIAIPEDPDRMAAGRNWTAFAGEGDRFKVEGVEPGRYRVYAFNGIEPGVFYQNPGALRAIEDRGKQVELEEGGHASIQLEIIPSADIMQALQEDQ
ncbi:MAG TPA: carboxypeptidase-like regulatory domain-containing protein [Bryobacteraceae bacterium]|nr:carboxypeptidase-like regulatory domain-containing protein [Bryobacteraceae bacterium]